MAEFLMALFAMLLLFAWQLQSWLGVRGWMRRYQSSLDVRVLDEMTFDWQRTLVKRYVISSDGRLVCMLPRDAVHESLREFLAGNGSFQQLRRLGALAPLIGVALTSFLYLMKLAIGPSASSQASLHSVLSTLSPFFVGVLVAVFMAMINQFLLYSAERSIARLRQIAMDWFDASFWLPMQASAAREVQQTRDAMGRTAEMLGHFVEQLKASTERYEATAATFKLNVEALSGSVSQIDEKMAGFARATADAAETMTAAAVAARAQQAALEAAAPLAQEVLRAIEKNVGEAAGAQALAASQSESAVAKLLAAARDISGCGAGFGEIDARFKDLVRSLETTAVQVGARGGEFDAACARAAPLFDKVSDALQEMQSKLAGGLLEMSEQKQALAAVRNSEKFETWIKALVARLDDQTTLQAQQLQSTRALSDNLTQLLDIAKAPPKKGFMDLFKVFD